MLSTVGVCVYVDENGKVVASSEEVDRSASGRAVETLTVIQENETGLLLETVDALLCTMSPARFITSLRQRIQVNPREPQIVPCLLTQKQTFTFYSGVPLRAVINLEMTRSPDLLFAGTFASVLYECLDALSAAAIEVWRDTLLEELGNKANPTAGQRWMRGGIFFLETA